MQQNDRTRSNATSRPSSSLTVVEVPFHGRTIPAVLDGDTVRVPISPVCKMLGLSNKPQLEKLKTLHWATVTMIVTVGADGKNREMATIDLDSVMMWLATIDVCQQKKAFFLSRTPVFNSQLNERVRHKMATFNPCVLRRFAQKFFFRFEKTAAKVGTLKRKPKTQVFVHIKNTEKFVRRRRNSKQKLERSFVASYSTTTHTQ